MPRSRIPIFTTRMEQLCDEADLPRFDDTTYDLLQDILLFLWHDPEFCIAVPLAGASIHGMTAADLRGTWDRKFGTAKAA